MDDQNKRQKRSPLRRRALRNPGESLQEEIQQIRDDQLLVPLFMAFMLILFAVHEWWRWFSNSPPAPISSTLIALAGVGYGSYKWVVIRKRIKSLRLGLEGEKAVGQFLEALRSQGCRIFHDIVGNGFNIDHVIIGPRGVFTIETKTYSKPIRGKAIAAYNGEKLTLNGMEPDRNPIVQSRAARDWLANQLFDTTAKRYSVKGVVVLPGWYVELIGNKRQEIWVLNPKALPAFIEHEPAVLKDEDIALASSRIINYVTR